MIAFPSIATLGSARVYEDSEAADIAYVDPLEPAPVQGDQPARWFPLPGELAYLAGEVRFGPGPEGFGDVGDRFPDRRLMPVPWNISPVYVWYREGERSRVVAQGKTSGFGASNAIFNGTAPLGAMISPVRIGAELTCPARVTVGVRGSGDPAAVLTALNEAAVHDDWDASLGEILMARLAALVESGALTVAIEGDGLDDGALEELRGQVLLEWARRFQTPQASTVTLAWPRSALDQLHWSLAKDLEIDWYPGDAVVLRGVRILRCSKLI